MKKIICLGIFLLAATYSYSATVLYDLGDTVLDGNAGENTYIVTNSQAGAGLSHSGGENPSLVYTMGGTNTYTYLVANFSSFTLANVGDAISLNYSFTPSSTSSFRNVAESFRVGFFNSNETLMADNSSSTGDAQLSDDRGYAATYNPSGGADASNTFRQRTNSNPLLWGSSYFVKVTDAPTLSSPGTGTVTGVFTLTRVETGIEIKSVVNGGAAQTIIDTAGLETTFDSFSVFTNSGTSNPTLTFSELTVSTVPEPSVALFLGVAGIAFICRRNRSGL